MSYTATNWQNGDVITAAKLNKAEQGVASMLCAYLVINVDVDMTDVTNPVYIPDMTSAEVIAEINRGRVPIYNFAYDDRNVIMVAAKADATQITIKGKTNVFMHDETGLYNTVV